MPLQLEIRERARRDLLAIVGWIALQENDFIVAGRLGQRLLDRCEEITRAPGMGSPYLPRPGVRKLNEGPYKIFYAVAKTKITVLRIWDGRRGAAPPL